VFGVMPLQVLLAKQGEAPWMVELDCLTCAIKKRTLALDNPTCGMPGASPSRERRLQELLARAAVVKSLTYPLTSRYMEAARGRSGGRGTEAVAEGDGCPICMEGVQLVALPRCGHELCGACKQAWILTCKRERKTLCCPLCRTPFTGA
jgi:hypothetical protein